MQTDLPPAPDEQLEVIQCNCQTACGNCTGSSCSDSTNFTCKEDNLARHTEVIGSYACFTFYLSFLFIFIIG